MTRRGDTAYTPCRLWGAPPRTTLGSRAGEAAVQPQVSKCPFGISIQRPRLPLTSNPSNRGMHKQFIGPVAALCLMAPAIGAASTTTWERWETSFQAQQNHTNPYTEVTLAVEFTDPHGATTVGLGFWDGGSTWRVRFAFPEPGTWSYRTTCSVTSDSGLHNRTGTIQVSAYTGENPVRKHGYPIVDTAGRHLTYADGTPFLFLADTAWEPWFHFSLADWETYLDNRVAKKFTAILNSCGFDNWWETWSNGGCDNSIAENIGPFTGSVGEAEEPNPVFFRKVDAFIEAQNERGLVAAVFGLMNAGDHAMITDDDRRLFAQTMAARLQGSAVILSPPVDDDWSRADYMNDVGQHLNDQDDGAYQTLLTYHMGTSAYNCGDHTQPGSYTCDLHDESWVDFTAYQSGHNKPKGTQMAYWAVRRAREMPLHYRSLSPAKPVMNVEPLYEMPPSWFPPSHDVDDNAYRCRQIGWTTLLSGACGHAFGVWGVWDYGRYRLSHCATPAADWHQAMDNEFSWEAAHIAEFFQDLEWHTLEPRHDLIRDQTSHQRRKKVLAQDIDGEFLVAYMPRENTKIEIRLSELAADGDAWWINPRTGEQASAGTFSNQGDKIFSSPDAAEDWGLLLVANITSAGLSTPESSAPQAHLAVRATQPNPFSYRTSITISVPARGDVFLGVYDAAGRPVRTLADTILDGPRDYAFEWDGNTQRGEQAASGLYFVKLVSSGNEVTRKVVRLR